MEFLPFFLVLFAAVFFSEVFQRLHLPWVVALILGGIILGPFGFGWEPGETISFLGQIGLVFLMFMAGLEIRFSEFRKSQGQIALVSLLNASIPFVVGFSVAYFFGFSIEASILLGIIFISSAVAVVIPTLESNNLLGSKPGKIVTPVAVFEDIFSLVLLAIFLQMIDPVREGLPIWLFLLLLVISVIVLRIIIPKIQWILSPNEEDRKKDPQEDFRATLAILLGTVVIFSLLGLHPIVGGFFAGLILSDSIKGPELKSKLRIVGYGIFIPIFFIVIGAQTDLGAFLQLGVVFALAIAVVFSSMFSKFISGYIGGRLIGFSKWESALMGTSTLPQLSITLAVAFTGVELGILTTNLATTLVILTIVTTFLTPILIKWISRKLDIRVV